ncbi:DUF6266 family protein [Pedobacter sp. L105]|uniref:DUF6266 family protein n=1 Tax=Pedobacter sp. L105 TaxID=1641871 RepID=UPI00131E2548|nr:DUF6266 family protein [Pedobacter sp. L105]
MATNKNSFDGFMGKRGNVITYLRLGIPTSRSAATKISKKATQNQKMARHPTQLVNDFIASAKQFIYLGFQSEANLAHKTSHDLVNSYTRLHAIKGNYPDMEIDYTKVLFTRGKMPATPNVQAKLNDDGLVFTWDTSLIRGQFHANDQVMLLAYFPDTKSSEYVLFGGTRASGTAQLSLLANETATVMETYISFISADHKNISNSMYTGQLILPAATSNGGSDVTL